ncbi:sigma-E processing peptidase SpoIIGA [Oceanobacillus sp. 143]|uniref:Sporulation sigma-E factor-processing peptidase n=1 Tax=Oceanobacillus zhaokaii TaxID=2052660 RepID=A0A345PG72_9BACI|nr:sigma-E processing peptidase SpoIIGA [Oceanobacillus zhaokaii]AXI09002.1 sigma-E processing peptidase SpoIIGA [Oceanobacillus zhaokaii]QGS68606.1 sigma-E processing peptidase SpoIIGA [Oceanobacillus sp. 143]
MTIYLDAVWALNFILDMMLLLLTQALSRDNARKRRILLGAFIASLLVPITIYFPDSFISSVFGKLFYSALIIFSTFGYRSIYRFSRLLLLFYFTTFAIGGGLIGLHFLLQNRIGVSGNSLLTFSSGYGDPVSWIFVVTGFPIVWLFTKSRMDKHVMEKIRYDQLYEVLIQINNQSFATTGYIDSGNQLVDPLSKKPVIICDEFFLKQWFTDVEWELLKIAQETLDFEILPKNWENKIQIVPYQGVGGKSMFLITIRPEQLIVYYNEQKIVSSKVLIGIQFAELVKDGSYHCLLQPQIIKLASVHSA